MTSQRIEYADMIGHVFTEIYVDNLHHRTDRILFVRDDGYRIAFTHTMQCCESVIIEDINGDYKNLVGKPLRVAEMYTTNVPDNLCEDADDLYTFYRFANEDEFVTVRWHGSSNGCYSLEVDKYELMNGQVTHEGKNYPWPCAWKFEIHEEE